MLFSSRAVLVFLVGLWSSLLLLPSAGQAVESGDFLTTVIGECETAPGFLTSHSIVAIDGVTGDREIISGFSEDCSSIIGAGTPFLDLEGLEWNEAGMIVASDGDGYGNSARIMLIDPSTGNRTVLSGCEDPFGNDFCQDKTGIIGSGPFLAYYGRIAVVNEAAADRSMLNVGDIVAYVSSHAKCPISDSLMIISAETGDRRIFSGYDATCRKRGTGHELTEPDDFEISPNGHLYMTNHLDFGEPFDAQPSQILEVDLDSGNRTVISGCSMMSYLEPSSCAGTMRGTGPVLEFIHDIAVARQGFGYQDLIYARGSTANCLGSTIVQIDPLTGNRVAISGAVGFCTTLGAGTPFSDPGIFELDGVYHRESGAYKYMDVDRFGNLVTLGVRVFDVDRTTGARTVLSGCSGEFDVVTRVCTGGLIGDGIDFTEMIPRHLVAVPEPGFGALVLLGGALLMVAGRRDRVCCRSVFIGAGAMLMTSLLPAASQAIEAGDLLTTIELDCVPSTNPAFLPGYAVVSIDGVTGDREIVSGHREDCSELVGEGTTFLDTEGLAWSESGKILVADGDGVSRIIEVDPTTGDRTVISGCIDPFDPVTTVDCFFGESILGSGPRFTSLSDLTVATQEVAQNSILSIGDIVARATTFSECPNSYHHSIARVSLETGDRTLVSGMKPNCTQKGSGPALHYSKSHTLSPDGKLYVSNSLGTPEHNPQQWAQLLSVDLVKGDRTLVSGCSSLSVEHPTVCVGTIRGSGPALEFIEDIAIFRVPFPSAIRVIVRAKTVNCPTSTLLEIDPVTGNREALSGAFGFCATLGAGPPLTDPGEYSSGGVLFDASYKDTGVEFDAFGNIFTAGKNLIEVDFLSGDRTIISGCTVFDPVTGACVGLMIGGGANHFDFYPRALAAVPEPDFGLMLTGGAVVVLAWGARRSFLTEEQPPA